MTRQDPATPEEYCVLELEQKAFEVGIIGAGPGFNSILDILFDEKSREYLPDLNLVALSEPGPDRGKLKDPRLGGLPVYETHAEMLAAHPGLEIVIELVGQKFKLRTLRNELSERVSLIDHTVSFLLCALSNYAKVSDYCRVNLDNQKLLLRSIIDEIPEDVILLDKNALVTDLNRHVSERRGLLKEDLIGKPCFEAEALQDNVPFCHPGSRDCPFYDTLRTGEKSEALKTRVDASGHLQYFRIYSYPIREAGGGISHVMIMRRDITDRTEGEMRLRQSEKIDVVGKMSTYLAHEIRNPLFAIGGFANSLLKSANLDSKEREKVRIILEETGRLDKILKSVLSFTRPADAPGGETEVASLVAETMALLNVDGYFSSVKVVLDIAKDLPRADGDSELIKQCLIDLVKNALEAMPDGGILSIRAAFEGGYVVLGVRDTGKGMSKDALERVFSPFFTTKEKGYGLGLAMIKKVLDDLGGKIDVNSQEGQGTLVSLRLKPILAVAAKPG